MYFKFYFHLFLLCCLILSSCSTSRILSSWNDDSLGQHSLGTLLVIGVAQDETKRRIYEDTFADSFIQAGTKAIASYTVSKQSIEPSEEALKEVVKKSNAQSVLITHLVSENEKSYYQPSSVVVGTNSYSTGGLYGYYPFIRNSVSTTGSYTSTTKVVLESNLYDVTTEKLLWTARTESIDPVMTRKYYQQLIDLFINDLSKKNFL